MSDLDVRVYPDADSLAAAVAAALVAAIHQAQARRGMADIVLTGGGVGIKSLAAVLSAPGADGVDWSRVNVWWGDERFLPAGDPDRNETQAKAALLDALPLDPVRVHPMPTDTQDADDAARAYTDQLCVHAGDALDVPAFDVLMLGMGPEGHVASLFPKSPGIHAAAAVIAVHDSPKPPPVRLSLTLAAIRAAHAVWLIAAGEEKAEAVAQCVAGADPAQVPAAGARGQKASVLWVDAKAATLLG
ncbi:MAG: 6-phosphogluconolactonase [Actinobacteria bacterium]|nr:6-phosphogluconolactonase [Actinomycetota bacterium]